VKLQLQMRYYWRAKHN